MGAMSGYKYTKDAFAQGVHVRLDEEMHRQLKQWAAGCNMTMGEAVRVMIEEELSRDGTGNS